MKNDKKINDLLAVIATKKKTISTKPRAVWKSNGLLKCSDGSTVNVNVSQIGDCITAVAYILRERDYRMQAETMLGVSGGHRNFPDYLEDFKLRASILKWEEEKRKLDVLEAKLKDLRSEDAKTEDALSDIMQELT